MHTSNTLKTVVLLSGLAGFMVLIGTLLGGTTGLVIGLLFGLGIVGASYWSSDKLAVKAACATEVAPGQLDWLRDDLAEIARRADMPTPSCPFMSPDPQPNVFATGRSEKTALVCVTAGLLQVLDRNEVRGVVAHEVAHIRNKDILIGSIAKPRWRRRSRRSPTWPCSPACSVGATTTTVRILRSRCCWRSSLRWQPA